MSNAEDYIPVDEETGLLSDESSDSLDLEELQQLLGEIPTSETNDLVENLHIDDVHPSTESDHPVSALEELEELYGVSDGLEVGETEISLETEEPVREDTSDSVSILEELEALYGGSDEPDTDNVDIQSELSELSSYEEDVSVMPALDELKVFLGEIDQSETEETGDSYTTSQEEYSFVSQRSVLDELQNLLQSCIDELKATDDGDIGKTSVSTEVEYPTRNELKDLLETKLSQLMMISDSSASSDYMSDGSSVLDELNALLGETGNNASMSESYLSSAEADELPEVGDDNSAKEVDEYISSLESGHESSLDDEVTGADSILDELEELLGKSGDADSETSVVPSVSDYSTADASVTDVPGESSVLDELEALLSESTETSDSEVVQESSTISAPEDTTGESSVMEELEAYFGDSETMDVDVGVPAEETQVDAETDTLEQLEAMLGESAGYEASNTINVIEDDLPVQYETSKLSGKGEEEKDKDTRELHKKVPPVEVEADTRVQKSTVENVYSTDEMEDNKRLPIGSMLLVASVVAGVIIFWNMSDTEDSLNDRLKMAQARRVTEPAVSDLPAQEAAYVSEYETLSENTLEEGLTSYVPAEIEDIDYSYTSVETADYEPEQSYANESYDEPVQSYENELYDEPIQSYMDEPLNEGEGVDDSLASIEAPSYEPEQLYEDESYVDETLNSEGIDSSAEVDAEQAHQPVVTSEIPANRSIESVNQQVNNLPEDNRNNINQLEIRMVAAELSITKLQEEKAAKQEDAVKPLSSDQSESPRLSEQSEPPVAEQPVVEQPAVKQPTVEATIDNTQSMDSNMWSVHLSAYYSKPPPDIELEVIKNAGIPYEIQKVNVKGGVWYRVLINNYSEYRDAKEKAERLKERLGIEKIWVSKN